MNRSILVLLAVLLFLAVAAHAEQDELPQPSELPIEVSAQRLEALRDQRQAIFTGDVIAKQGDLTLYCEKLVVYSLPEEDKVDRLEASGGVRVVQLDRTATAERAVYRRADSTLVLMGNAQVHQGQNQVSGDEITVFLLENRSLVKSHDSGRVRAVLFPEQKKQEPQ